MAIAQIGVTHEVPEAVFPEFPRVQLRAGERTGAGPRRSFCVLQQGHVQLIAHRTPPCFCGAPLGDNSATGPCNGQGEKHKMLRFWTLTRGLFCGFAVDKLGAVWGYPVGGFFTKKGGERTPAFPLSLITFTKTLCPLLGSPPSRG